MCVCGFFLLETERDPFKYGHPWFRLAIVRKFNRIDQNLICGRKKTHTQRAGAEEKDYKNPDHQTIAIAICHCCGLNIYNIPAYNLRDTFQNGEKMVIACQKPIYAISLYINHSFRSTKTTKTATSTAQLDKFTPINGFAIVFYWVILQCI